MVKMYSLIIFLVGFATTCVADYSRFHSLSPYNATQAPVVDLGYSLNRANLVQVEIFPSTL